MEQIEKTMASKGTALNVARLLGKPGAGKMINAALFTSRLGSILSPLIGWGTLAYTSVRLAELSFKAAVGAMDYANAKVQQIRSLEFGGTLGAGFQTQEAATERQRAVQMLQRTHLGGRRGLGTEASNYHLLI